MVGLSIGVHKTETLIERGTRSQPLRATLLSLKQETIHVLLKSVRTARLFLNFRWRVSRRTITCRLGWPTIRTSVWWQDDLGRLETGMVEGKCAIRDGS